MKYITKEEIQLLFNKLGINYLENYTSSIDGILKGLNFYNSDYYLSNIDEFNFLTEKCGDLIKNNYLNDVYISLTENKGYGLFANRDINESELIGVYFGQINEIEEFVEYDENGFDTDYAWDFPDEIEGFPLMEINAKYSGNELGFANHSNNPNLRVEHTVVNNMWYIFFVADIDIKLDTELTISYGENYWESEYRELKD